MLKTSSIFSRSQSIKAAKKVDSEDRGKNKNGDMEFLAKFKSSTNFSNDIEVTKPDFLTLNAKKVFYYLCKAFIKAPIL